VLKIFTFIFLLFSTTIHAQEYSYSPHVKLIYNSKEKFSGTIIKCKEEILILTCAHGIGEGGEGDVVDAEFRIFNTTQVSATLPMMVKTINRDQDLMLLSAENTHIICRPFVVDPKFVEPGTRCLSCGFPLGGNYDSRYVVVESYNMFVGSTKAQFMVTRGSVELGMSGGPLIRNGKLVGVLSSRINGENEAHFVPAKYIVEFLKD